MHRSDTEIQEEVLRALAADGRVRRADVGVCVEDGVVTLAGVLPSDDARDAAEEATHAVCGVLDVANELRVHAPDAPEPTDGAIARAVRRALQASALGLSSGRVRVTVRDGVVCLEGAVDRVHDADEAWAAAKGVDGAREVRNRLVVTSAWLAVEEAHTIVTGALARHASHVARHVSVDVVDGTVVVEGEVSSQAEHDAAIGALRGAPGVLAIDDRLRVHSGGAAR